MKSVQIYDKAMCCQTGVCGPEVDPVLPRFAADLQWLEQQGVEVKRYNLAQDPAEFAGNPTVQATLTRNGAECLPLVLMDDRILSRGAYPSREMLAVWANIPSGDPVLPLAIDESDCCGESDCC